MRLTKPCLLLLCCLFTVQLLLPSGPAAKMYTWTDKNGIVRRTYYPPPADQVRKSSSTKQNTSSNKKKVRKNKVDLYVTSWCPYCKKAINFFWSKGVAVNVYDIEKDKKAASRKKKLDDRSGVPFAVVNGTRIHGYAPDQYAAALKK